MEPFSNSSAWIPNTELTPLDPATCKEVNEKGKAKALVAAYHVAAENHDLQYFKDMLADHERAMQEDQEAREARAAAKAAKSDKKKRKSTDVVEEDEDVEMEGAEEGEGRKKTQSAKKRRKAVESEGENEKVMLRCPALSLFFCDYTLGGCTPMVLGSCGGLG